MVLILLAKNVLEFWTFFQRSLCREDNSSSNDVHFLWKYWLEGDNTEI